MVICKKPILRPGDFWASSNRRQMFGKFDRWGRKWYRPCVELNKNEYPEVTFENSPKELIIK